MSIESLPDIVHDLLNLLLFRPLVLGDVRRKVIVLISHPLLSDDIALNAMYFFYRVLVVTFLGIGLRQC